MEPKPTYHFLSGLPATTAPDSTQVKSPTCMVHIFNLSDALAEFRAQLEREAGCPFDQIEVSASFVLDDLCAFLGFGPSLRDKVLGRDAVMFVDHFLSGDQARTQSNESNA